MNHPDTPQLTTTDIAAMAEATGIALAGNRLATVTDLANRFRDSTKMLRAYLSNAGSGSDREPG